MKLTIGQTLDLDELLANEPNEINSCVVRLRTDVWEDRRGLHQKKSLLFMRKQCKGFNILEEDIGAVGAAEILPRIININECKDGIYKVVTCNESHDFESGYIDDYDYRLINVSEEMK